LGHVTKALHQGLVEPVLFSLCVLHSLLRLYSDGVKSAAGGGAGNERTTEGWHPRAIVQIKAPLFHELALPVAVPYDSQGTATDNASSDHQRTTTMLLLLLRNYLTTRSPSQC